MTMLSISIPTYNRANKLDKSISRLVEQIVEDHLEEYVEIVISDNSSIDNTSEICNIHKSRNENLSISYNVNEDNFGFDKNVHCAIVQSKSPYVWTMSDDDVLYPGAIKEVIAAIRNRDFEFAFVNYEILVNGCVITSRYGQGGLEEIPARDMLARISFSNSLISACIFKREAWIRCNPERFFGSLWIHFYMAAAMLSAGRALIIGQPLFAQKQGSLEHSRAERKVPNATGIEFYMQAHLNFLAFAAGLRANGHSEATAQQADRIARREDVHQIVNYKLTADVYSPRQIARTWRALAQYRAASLLFWLLLTPMLLMPSWPYHLARLSAPRGFLRARSRLHRGAAALQRGGDRLLGRGDRATLGAGAIGSAPLSRWRFPPLNADLLALVVQRSWLSISGFVTVMLLPATLTLPQQGLFFTFLSIVALQTIFEAGITSAFVNHCAHDKVAFMAAEGDLGRVEQARQRLASVAGAARRWFSAMGVVFGSVVGIGGYFYLARSMRPGDAPPAWEVAYALLIVGVSVALAALGRIAIVEGWGGMGQIARVRFRASLASGLSLWAGLVLGLGVWSLPISYAVQSTLVWIGTASAWRALPFLKAANDRQTGEGGVDWRREIWPLQSRLGVSYFCGYLVSQAVVPFAFRYYGSMEAGRVGFAIAIYGAGAAVLGSLIYLSGPHYARHAAERDWVALDERFRRVTGMTLALAALAFSGLIAVLWLLETYVGQFKDRLPTLLVLGSLGVISLCNLYVGSVATLLRSFRREPMLGISVLAAILYGAAMIAAHDSASSTLFIAMAAIQLLVIVPLTFALGRRFLHSARQEGGLT